MWQSGPYSAEVLMWLLVQPILALCFGSVGLQKIVSILGASAPQFDFFSKRFQVQYVPHLYVLGLELYLVVLFILKCSGVAWAYAIWFPVLFVSPVRLISAPVRLARLLWQSRPRSFTRSLVLGTLSVVLFLAMNLWIASGLLYYQENSEFDRALFTRWTNTYGDFPFHMGMISSFTVGDNFPPEYHFAPGVRLCYPFMINFWSSSLLSVGELTNWSNLGAVVGSQWVIVWMLVFYFLRGHTYYLLPWALLFGGRSFDTLDQWSEASLQVGKGYPWSGFMTTVWAPQRSAPFGCAVCLAALSLYHSFLNELENEEPSSRVQSEGDAPVSGIGRLAHPKVIVCGLILALAPLVHTHICLVSILYVGVSLGLKLLHALKNASCSRIRKNVVPVSFPTAQFVNILYYVVCLVPSLCFLPWILNTRTTGMISFMWGWRDGDGFDSRPPMIQLRNAAMLWYRNAPYWLLSMAVVWVLSRKHSRMMSVVTMFLAANFVKLALWYWDQLKVFIGVYMIFLAIWSSVKYRKGVWIAHLLCILLLYPSAHETFSVLTNPEEFHNNPGIYIDFHLDYAEEIIKRVPPTEMVLSTDKHNTPVSLTGRRILLGYGGWLWTHNLGGVSSAAKQTSNLPINELVEKCYADPRMRQCPYALIWSHEEISQFSHRKSRSVPNDTGWPIKNWLKTEHPGVFIADRPPTWYHDRQQRFGR